MKITDIITHQLVVDVDEPDEQVATDDREQLDDASFDHGGQERVRRRDRRVVQVGPVADPAEHGGIRRPLDVERACRIRHDVIAATTVWATSAAT